jgi:hypothetical protein
MGVAAGGSRRLMMAARPSRTIFTRSQIMVTKRSTTKKAPARKATAKTASTTKGAGRQSKATASTNGSKKLSAIDAAAKVLTDSKEPLNCKELVEAMAARKLWTSPGGKTPHATVYSAILREINTKGKDARFNKTERGKFAPNG